MYQGTEDTSSLDVLFLSAPCRNQCWRWWGTRRRLIGGSSGTPAEAKNSATADARKPESAIGRAHRWRAY